uniref:Uncharacterized protein n=1 Tax=Timspurckia oligopyrenoides TaxID=708627 RepID=A0A7S0ZFT7_9RHOD|mmetsp:Transcript_3552/g.6220  ORF Transcript_3552/g.6220 Transcript_3552/m.6220 type:complete len:181 (+) Transcript_3552:81-623(+)|eukprot:CAMPEP_0182442224 /NCGR_PEP_ID=MMETSP1172-20130603/1164_1 /TAXON_ID=708627 /ORGANISM="Timspurckia oligopyrenoides, Strain CCMP3278" /LENGTH=180 /DNA_ID=CAMNT_0024636967 /DNA_START=63 /DNA_END=605 /DNA_ORIENTATION=-
MGGFRSSLTFWMFVFVVSVVAVTAAPLVSSEVEDGKSVSELFIDVSVKSDVLVEDEGLPLIVAEEAEANTLVPEEEGGSVEVDSEDDSEPDGEEYSDLETDDDTGLGFEEEDDYETEEKAGGISTSTVIIAAAVVGIIVVVAGLVVIRRSRASQDTDYGIDDPNNSMQSALRVRSTRMSG